MLDTKLKEYIIRLYSQIEEIHLAEEVKEGYLSHNYVLETNQGKYFLKQYRDKYTENGVKDVHKIVKFFSDNKIPSVTAIENKQRNTYFVFHSHIYTLFPFLNAIPGDRENLNEQSIKSLARTLAKIHLISIDGPPLEVDSHQGSIDRERFLNPYFQIIEILNSKKRKDEFDNLALQVLNLKKTLVDRSIEKVNNFVVINDHLLHGDYHEKNAFFDENGEVKYVFDWEKTEIGNRLHELIRSMDFVCLNGKYSKKRINRARLYIQSYKELYPFDKGDFLDAIEAYYLKNAHSIWIEKTHYLENSDRVDCFLENQLALLNYYPKNYKRLTDCLGA